MVKKNKEELENNYNHITTLKNLEGIRKRPGMYIGTTQSLNGENPSGLIQMAQEILSNAIDEAYAGFGNEITLIVHKDNSLTVIDHGRGIPMGDNMDDAIRSFTKLHSSGKFDSNSYQNSIGINGLGQKICVALSSKVECCVTTSKGEEYYLRFENQQIAEKKFIKQYSKAAMKKDDFQTGTKITFWPDDTIFDVTKWDRHVLEQKMEQSAFLTPKVKFIFIDERKEKDGKPYNKEWYSETGMPDYVSYISESEDLVKGLKKPISFSGTYTDEHNNDIDVDGALIYTEDSDETVLSFANGVSTYDGGFHVDGAHKGIYRAFIDYAKDKKILKKNQKLDLSDTTEGLILALLVKIPENILMFESQSKTKLSTAVAQPAVQQVVYDTLTKWLYDHTSAAKHIIENMLDAKSAREAAIKAKKVAREARKTKSNGGKLIVSEKLKRASSTKPADKELIITEGASACLVKDTNIRLANGEVDTIGNISKRIANGEKLYVYSLIDQENIELRDYKNKYDKGLRVEPILDAKVTRHNAELVRVYIDNDTYVDCTPDHKFLLLDGTYCEAKDLKPNMSLAVMPIHKNHNGKYLSFHGVSVHRLIAHQYHKDTDLYNMHVHHKDINKLNNTPENLEILTPSEHAKRTAKEAADRGDTFGARTSYLYHHDPEYRARQKEIQAYGGRCGKGAKHHVKWDKAQREKTSITTKLGMAKMSSEQKYLMRYHQRVNITLASFKTILKETDVTLNELKVLHKEIIDSPKYGKKSKLYCLKKELNLSKQTSNYDYLKDEFNNDKEFKEAIMNANHKIVKVEKLNKREDVYDLTIKDIHNFCLDNDVFVHNCGSIVKCRDAKTQAVFPLRGKILNVFDTNLAKALKNVEITTIANVLGAGIGPAFDVKDLQYNKVCIASDQDDDGFAIRSLCITLFDKLFPGLIENGYLYVIDSPLFVDFWYEKGKRKEVFAYSNEEQQQRIKELNKKKIKFEIQRNKGLGELDQASAKKALTNPETRHLTQITIDDVHKTKQVLKLFMSKKSAAERKDWVYDNIDFSVDDELEDEE